MLKADVINYLFFEEDHHPYILKILQKSKILRFHENIQVSSVFIAHYLSLFNGRWYEINNKMILNESVENFFLYWRTIFKLRIDLVWKYSPVYFT